MGIVGPGAAGSVYWLINSKMASLPVCVRTCELVSTGGEACLKP